MPLKEVEEVMPLNKEVEEDPISSRRLVDQAIPEEDRHQFNPSPTKFKKKNLLYGSSYSGSSTQVPQQAVIPVPAPAPAPAQSYQAESAAAAPAPAQPAAPSQGYQEVAASASVNFIYIF
jgi:hypothetical protein